MKKLYLLILSVFIMTNSLNAQNPFLSKYKTPHETPPFDKIKNEIERLRIELSMLLLERDELQFVICRNIEAKYTLEFGSIEYRAYEAQCTALRLKRKIELIQAKRNRQEPVSIVAIEEITFGRIYKFIISLF